VWHSQDMTGEVAADEVQRRVRRITERAYWDAVASKLVSEPDLARRLVEELRDGIMLAVPVPPRPVQRSRFDLNTPAMNE
jgi:hypothetical protein